MRSKHLLLMLLLALCAPWAAMGQTVSYPTWGSGTTYYISEFKVVSGTTTLLDNTTTGTAGQSQNYYDSHSITVNPGDVLSLTTTVGGAGSYSTFGFGIWADLDNNGLTTDDRIYTSNGYKTSPHIGSFTIPSTATEGEYRLRVLIDYNTSNPTDPNGSYIHGESEDYKLIVTVPAYPKPGDLQVTGTDHESANFSWSAPGAGPNTLTGYAYQYKLASETDWPTSWTNLNDASATTLTIHSLAASTSYNFRLKALYDSNGSDFIETSFSTTAQAEAVGDSWSDDFEGTECGWQLINGECTNAWAWGQAAHNGDGSLKAIYISNNGGTTHAYTNNSAAMVYTTKLLTFEAGKYTFKYDWIANAESCCDYMRVALVPSTVVLTANTNGTTPSGFSSTALPTGWIALDGGGKLNGQNTWQNKEVTVNVTAGNYYLVLAWRNDSSTGPDVPAAVDNFQITKVTCDFDVTELAVASTPAVTPHAATITWAGEADNWHVAWSKTNSFPEASTNEEIVSTNEIVLGGLDAGSTYYVRVRAYCGGEDYGAWCDAIDFDTKCEAFTDFPWIENFDSYTGATSGSTNNLPICWNYINECSYSSYEGYPVIYNASSSSHSGNNHLRFMSRSGSSYDPKPQYAILPQMEDIDGLRIKFYARANSTNSSYSTYDATFKVGVMTDPADATTFTEVATYTPASTTYELYTIPFNTYTGNGTYIAIMIEAAEGTGSSNYRSVFIDDIIVEEIPSCLEPSGLAVTNNGLKAVLTWISEAHSFDIAWSTDANANPDNITGTVGTSTTSPFTTPDLEIDNDYYFWVRTKCTNSNSSPWTDPVSVHIGYCVPNPSSRDGKGITKVNFGIGADVVNNVDETNGLPATSPYYGNYSTMIGALQAGVESTVSITYATGSSTVYSYGTIIWVDWDNSLSFEDDEIIYTGTSTQGSGGVPQVLNATFTIPATQDLGDYRMRIAGADSYFDSYIGGTATGNHSACFSSTYAVCHDYTLRVLEAPSCPQPTDLEAGTPEAHQVELSWTENGTATAWQIMLNDDEENLVDVEDGFTILGDVVTYTLSGLTQDADYSVKVRAYCNDEDQSFWSGEETFTTAIACAKPTELTQTNITTNSATLSWTGTSDSYVLQYRPWSQVGEDKQSTGEFVTYNYDLSAFSGQGSIAIRHYDVSDKFYLNVDNVVLKAANGSTIFEEGFESGTIPASWTNYDVDGDGYTWDIASSSNMSTIGYYAVYSASWLSGLALHPDNWLIISNVELGGTFSFAARGQDPAYPDENFAVYVSLESDITEVPVAATTYTVNNLTPGTPYAWQVKGICGTDESNWVTSLFNTKDDVLIFAADGNWNDLSKWTDVDGNSITALPTIENKVRVDADAIVPANVIATAGKTTLGDNGSITIKDGGQLKHNSATLWVTMEKGITGYGEGNEQTKDHYCFISTPFSGATQIEGTGTWSHVNNLADGTYDLYGFDPTSDGSEWINYKSNPGHAVYTAGNNYGLIFKRGYLYASEADRTVSFSGTISKTINNSMTESFEYDGTSTDPFNGWELVGNPFACNTYINYVDGETVLPADFYVMNTDGDGYNLSSSSVALPPLTGAFINYSAAGTVQFATEAPAAPVDGMLNMNLTQNNGKVDQARVRFGQGINLKHMSFNQNSSKLYMPVEGNDYAVVYAEAQGEMPVSFKAENNGSYTLSFNTENLEFGYLHLIDNMTGEDVNLLETPSYSFEAKTTDYASRFRLVFATGNNGTDETFAFISNGSFVINNEGNATLQVVDVMGRILRSETINGSANVNVNAAPGVYVLRLINGDNVRTQKVVVR